MPRWNENLFPPNGFEFFDAEKIRHTGKSIHDLISNLAAYRTRRGLDAGDPIAEVNEQLCEKYPSRCLNGKPAEKGEATSKTRKGSLGTRIAGWLRLVWGKASMKRIEYASEEQVKARVRICAACPKHVSMPGNCAACAETVNTISFQLRAGRDDLSSLLRMCDYAATDLRVDVLLQQNADPNAPSNCWKRTPSI